RAEESRRDTIDLDVMRGELDGERAGEHAHATLARRIGHDVRPADIARQRAEVDDFAAPARLHAWNRRPCDEKRSVEVGRHERSPVVIAEAIERTAFIYCCIVDEDIDRRLAFERGDR